MPSKRPTPRPPTDTLSIYAYAPSEYEAAQLNERVKQAMLAMAGQDAICNVAFYTDFSDDDTEYKVPRYQSIYNVTYYSDEV